MNNLTEKRLAAILCEDVCGKAGLSFSPPCDDHIDQAERLFPLIAGPAPAAPPEPREFVACSVCGRSDLVAGGTHICRGAPPEGEP